MATIRRDGAAVARLPLAYAGTASQFAAAFRPPSPGLYEVLVSAFDPATGNAGVDRTTFIVADD